MVDDDPLMFDEDEDFAEEAPQKSASLAEIWHGNPALKLFTVVAVIAAGVIGFMMMGGESEVPDSRVGTASSSISETPGESELNPAYVEAIKKKDEERLERAKETGGSVIPTPLGKQKNRIEAPVDQDNQDLDAFRRISDEARRQRFQRERSETPDQPDEDSRRSDQNRENCLADLEAVIEDYPSGFQNMYNRLFSLLTSEEHCLLSIELEALSETADRRLLGIMSALSPEERTQTLSVLPKLLGQTKERFVNTLNELSRTGKGRYLTLLSELADDLKNKLTDIMSGLPTATNQRLMSILEPMNDADRRRLIELLATLGPDEQRALIDRLFGLSPDERIRELRRLNGMSPSQIRNEISSIMGNDLRDRQQRQQSQQPQLRSGQQPQFAGIQNNPEYIKQLSSLFGSQVAQILEQKKPGLPVKTDLGIARPFNPQNLNNSGGGSFLRPNNQTAPATRPYDPDNLRAAAQAQSQGEVSGTTTGGGETIAARQNVSGGSFANFAGDEPLTGILYSAGDIGFAQVITQANSDVPGPVLAYLASGPLAGGRMLGQFSVSDDKLVVNFSTIIKDKKEYAVNAIAIDPETTLPGVASGVDRHYFSRVILPGAVTFIEGFADAVVRQGTSVSVEGETVSTSQNDLDTQEELLSGFREAAEEFADIIDEESDRPITVRIDPGTRIGVLFLEKVLDDPIE